MTRIANYERSEAAGANTPPAKSVWEIIEMRAKRLCRENAFFELSWLRRRADLSDPSAEAYETSLVDQLVCHGWRDEEITIALKLWREKHNEQTYIQRTISKARKRMTMSGSARHLRREGGNINEGSQGDQNDER